MTQAHKIVPVPVRLVVVTRVPEDDTKANSVKDHPWEVRVEMDNMTRTINRYAIDLHNPTSIREEIGRGNRHPHKFRLCTAAHQSPSLLSTPTEGCFGGGDAEKDGEPLRVLSGEFFNVKEYAADSHSGNPCMFTFGCGATHRISCFEDILLEALDEAQEAAVDKSNKATISHKWVQAVFRLMKDRGYVEYQV